jgi:hypothetical protein
MLWYFENKTFLSPLGERIEVRGKPFKIISLTPALSRQRERG